VIEVAPVEVEERSREDAEARVGVLRGGLAPLVVEPVEGAVVALALRQDGEVARPGVRLDRWHLGEDVGRLLGLLLARLVGWRGAGGRCGRWLRGRVRQPGG